MCEVCGIRKIRETMKNTERADFETGLEDNFKNKPFSVRQTQLPSLWRYSYMFRPCTATAIGLKIQATLT